MAEEWSGKERRRHPRINLNGEVQSRIHTVTSAPVINLSLTGALLEVPCTLQPGTTYTLRIGLDPGRPLEIRSRVVRSYVHGFDRNEKGETVIKYRAAVQFVRLEEAAQARLEEFLNRIQNQAAATAQLRPDRAV